MLNEIPDTIEVTRPNLLGHSNLVNLPRTPPNGVHLHSLECCENERSEIRIKDVVIGGPNIILMAGPCSIENENQARMAAIAAWKAGATILRGGAFKPRTSPYSFQGLGEGGLKMQRRIADELGMLVVTEATGEKNLPIVTRYADIIQIGMRNSQCYEFLVAVGEAASKFSKAVLYKRGKWMTIEEWMLGAEHILAAGCRDVILCERGTILDDGSYGLDLEGIGKVREVTHLPIIADPTHASLCSLQVPELALKAVATGVDGLIIEVHPYPEEALCDGKRAVTPNNLLQITTNISSILPEGRIAPQPN
jgi:3-deoxy-7-phosphoheptulonate synthase